MLGKGEGCEKSCNRSTAEGLSTNYTQVHQLCCRFSSAANYNKQSSGSVLWYIYVSKHRSNRKGCNLQPFYCASFGVTATTFGFGVATAVGAGAAGCLGATAIRFLNVACILHAAFRRSGSAKSIPAMSCSGVEWSFVLAEGFAFEESAVCESHWHTVTACFCLGKRVSRTTPTLSRLHFI